MLFRSGVALQAADFRAVALSWRAQAPREPFEQVAHGARVEHVAHADQQGLLGQLEQVLTQLLTQAPGQVADLVERELYSAAYKLSGHHQLKAAELLGVTRNVLRGRLIQHGEIDARK